MIESIDTSLIDWSRAQFAMTAMYHWIFVPLTLGLAVVMGIMETLYYKTGKEFWKNTAKFWMKLSELRLLSKGSLLSLWKPHSLLSCFLDGKR